MAAVLKFQKPTPLEIFKHRILHSGKKSRQTAGSHVTDMAELGKCIVLCMPCEGRFNKRKHGYEQAKDIPVCRGRCDGCGQYFGCATFLRPPP